MKQETKLRIFFGIISLCILIHFFYYKEWDASVSMFSIGIWAPLIMACAILPPKKVRTPDYSKIVNFVGIFVSLCSFVIYFSWFLGIWSNIILEFFILLIIGIYFIFLLWYKNGWGK